MTVIMHEDSEMLQEVVVTGYTTQRKADLTGSISVVSMDEIAKQNENNPMKAMQGRVPGMNITADGTERQYHHPYSRRRYAEQQRPALHHRRRTHQRRYARTERQ